MNIAILGTGMVGQSLAAALKQHGHNVTIGTRDVAKALASDAPNAYGMPAFGSWHQQNAAIPVATFADAIANNEVLVNAILGILGAVPPREIQGKILIDVANDLDFSKGMPPTIRVVDAAGASVGERIQSAFPALRVVKSLSTMNAFVMVKPSLVAGGDSTVFMSGNDAEAKSVVRGILSQFGWKDILDLGDISSARAVEFLLPIWLRTMGVVGNSPFNFKIVR
jgi:8-hydroxy-5-deazaflavin:NADPH oxidoreductase